MNIHIILSTRNPSKAKQIEAIFNDPIISIQTLEQAGIEGEAIEDGYTLQENALKKAIYAREKSKSTCWTMADDTGIFITALNGEPGIKSARWAGETASTNDITQYCLDRLKNKNDRSAYFETIVALIAPDGSQYFFDGKITGQLLDTPKAPPQPKMPYSPLFKPDGMNKVWAEMSTEDENKISHRGQAFRKVLEFLKSKT